MRPDLVGDRTREAGPRARLDERLFAALVESSEDAILGQTPDGLIASWNPAAERLYGWSAEEAIGQSASLLVPPDRPNEWPGILERLRRGERIGHYQTVQLRKDGTRVEVSVAVSPIKDSAGTLLGISASARDITRQKRAEEALRKERHLLRAVLQGLEEGVLACDANGVLTLSSLPLLGTANVEEGQAAPEEGQLYRVFHPDRKTPMTREELPLFRALQGESFHDVELDATTAQGQWHTLLASGHPLLVGGTKLGAVLVLRDVTKQKERQASSSRLATLVESASDAIISTDTDGIIATWNPGAEQLYGHSAQEAEGKPVALVVPPERHGELAEILQAVLDGKRVEHFETIAMRKDGNRIDVSVGVSLLKDGSGRLLGTCWIGHGISKPKWTETLLAPSSFPSDGPTLAKGPGQPGAAAPPWLAVERAGAAVVIRFTRPDLDDILVVEAIGAALSRLAEDEGGSRFVLDFDGVSRVGSAVLGKVIAFHRKIGKAGGQVAVCALVPEVSQKFSATNLDKIIRIYPERQVALAAVLQG